MFNSNNQNGFAIIYGLVVLFLTTIGGMTFLYLSGKDKESSGNYLQMRDATFASKAAHNAFINLCESNPNFLIKQLEAYSSNHDKKWLFGSTINESRSENKISLWNTFSKPAFSAQIVNYDSSNFILEIEARGYGELGGRKKSYGIYKLNGLKRDVTFSPSHALYLGGGAENIDAPFIVYGNTFTNARVHTNSSGGLIINGDFKTGTTKYTSDASLTIVGKAFFRSDVRFQGTEPVFNGSVGIEGNISTDVNINVNGNFFFNGNNITGNNGLIKVAPEHTATYKSSIDNSRINANSMMAVDSVINIASALQMTNTSDLPPVIHKNLEDYITNSGGTIYTPSSANIKFDTYGWNLEYAYNNNSKWNDFLVIKVSSSINLNNDGGIFNGKAIWIIENINCPVNGRWYSSGGNSNTLIYLKDGASLTEFGFGNSRGFRGVIYSESNSGSSYKFGNNTTFNGSIIHKQSQPVKFQGYTYPVEIKYNVSVAEEFTNLGIFSPPSEEGAPPPKIVLKDIQIRPYLISLLY